MNQIKIILQKLDVSLIIEENKLKLIEKFNLDQLQLITNALNTLQFIISMKILPFKVLQRDESQKDNESEERWIIDKDLKVFIDKVNLIRKINEKLYGSSNCIILLGGLGSNYQFPSQQSNFSKYKSYLKFFINNFNIN